MSVKLVSVPPLHGTSIDTIAALRYMLHQAELGNITGCVIAASRHGLHYESAITGHCKSNPVYARGLALELCDEIRALPDPNRL